jgi:membrane protein implicated in regulation of membrane protease activity
MNFLFTWYNIPFLVSLGLSLLFALLQLVGGFGDSDSDVDVDADVDVDVDADADGDFFGDALGFLGIGKVPVMLVLTGFLGVFGLSGLLINTTISQAFNGYSGLAFAAAALGSLICAFMLTGRISRGFARLAPDSSLAVGFEQLVGRIGTVSSPQVSETYGRVTVRDQHGGTHTVYAVLNGGDPLPERSEVALLAYDQARRCFIVKPMQRS